MKKIHILTEGQTEETFVRTVLNPYYLPKGICFSAKLATTKKVKDGPDFKGGIVSYGKVRNDILNLLKDTSVVCVTTMIDYYGPKKNFPGVDTTNKRGVERAKYLEQKFYEDIGNRKFLPFFLMHEFEALLFVSPKEIAKTLLQSNKEGELNKIRNQFNTPEEINDDPATAPSKRLLKVFPGYQKPFYGPLVTQRIGLDNIRAECEHFNSWLIKLENFRI